MPHTYTNLLVHVIFSTKDRNPYLDADLRPRLFPYMGGILREMNVTPLAINGPADHVHGLLALPATASIADAMRVLKTNSSRWIHEQWPQRRGFAWQAGYGAFSVSRSNVEEVERYIARQEEHHRHVTFQEEFVAFLERHGDHVRRAVRVGIAHLRSRGSYAPDRG
jgi:REP element-mobilizing transposase RayT